MSSTYYEVGARPWPFPPRPSPSDGPTDITAVGTPEAWLPLRHLAKDENGDPALLRIVKSPTRWTFGDGRPGVGMSEIHDRIDAAGHPAGIDD